MAGVEDNIREAEWRDLADTILVFVCLNTLYDISLLIGLQDGLFAAFLSAFLVFTIPQLQPNNTSIAMDVLIHISQQLSNSTTAAYAPIEFIVSPSTAAVNVLFFLSLALVLIDAFLAMLVKSWIQEFDRGWRKYTVANLRAQERERRLQGLERWKLAELVALLPILIQTSFLLFCIGLLVLLFPIHLISAICFSLALMAGLSFYAFTTYVSTFNTYAPFSSPVSRGLILLINALPTTWITLVSLIARNVQFIISCAPFHIPRSLPPQEHQADIDPSTQSLSGNNKVARSLPRDNIRLEKRTRSHSQIDPQTYIDILERLIITTTEAVENIPVFLESLDQPIKVLTLRPSNVEKWRDLLHTTLGLLGDPSTFSDSVARTIARSALFCGADDKQLFRRLIYHFDHMCTDCTGKYEPRNSLFAPYLQFYCGPSPTSAGKVGTIIAFLEPSNAADAELLWMVNTIHKNPRWRYQHFFVYRHSLQFFTAVLTYVSSTEWSRRSQVPLTAAIIYAMHNIKSALETSGIGSIDGPYDIPGTVLTASEPKSVTFRQVGELDLWSDDCVELASSLLQPQAHCPGSHTDTICKFQLALIAALYMDSTKQAGHTSAFAKLLRLTNLPYIAKDTWGWADAYDQTKLAGYWYMVLFQEPIYQQYSVNSPVHDIGYIIIQTIKHCSKITLSALHLLDISIQHLCAMASSSSNLLTRDADDNLRLRWNPPGGPIAHYAPGPFNPWILLHLDTLVSQSSVLHQRELEQLEWDDTLEQVHIAQARLALYDSSQAHEYKEAKQLKPDPYLLNLFLMSEDYAVCTGAFKWCLKLATISQPNPAGGVHSTGLFIPETMGCRWIEHFIQVLCRKPEDTPSEPCEFLVEHLAPKWATLSPSWCCDFASVFLFSNLCSSAIDELPAYQWFTAALLSTTGPAHIEQLQGFLRFFATILASITLSLTWDQLTSVENWLAEIIGHQDIRTEVENILGIKRQHIIGETRRFFAELPMADLGMDE